MRLKAKSRLAELRKTAGLTQAQLAVFIGVSSNTIQNWEKDNGLDQAEKFLKLCEVLGCELEDLIEYVPTSDEKISKSKSFSLDELRKLRKNWGTDVKTKSNSPSN